MGAGKGSLQSECSVVSHAVLPTLDGILRIVKIAARYLDSSDVPNVKFV